MNINQQEQEVLVTQKVLEGKSHEQAYEEVKRDVEFLRYFKEDLREKKNEIKIAEKKLENIDKTFKKEFTKLKEMKEKPRESNSSRQHFATTYHLKRILSYLEETNNDVTMSELCEACCTSSDYIKSGLVFLERFDMVESKRNGKVQVYKRKY